ncbi:MAG: hypothetical protein FWC58_10695 [Desulfobulbus sp.]|nr:hypothetical protein [Desulfobulbus sp.]
MFILALTAVSVIWGALKAKAFMYAGFFIAPLAIFFLGKTTISPVYIKRQSPWGERTIDWDEVTDMEVLPNFFWIVFNGKDKRLAIFGPAVLEKKDDLPCWYIEEIAEQRGIPIKLNLLAFLKRSKGT